MYRLGMPKKETKTKTKTKTTPSSRGRRKPASKKSASRPRARSKATRPKARSKTARRKTARSKTSRPKTSSRSKPSRAGASRPKPRGGRAAARIRKRGSAPARKRVEKAAVRKTGRIRPPGRTGRGTGIAIGEAIDARGLGAEAAGQSGDTEGLSRAELADSESVEELVEEGQAFEAGIVSGVENAPDADEGEIRTREVPEDDVPQEYLDED